MFLGHTITQTLFQRCGCSTTVM